MTRRERRDFVKAKRLARKLERERRAAPVLGVERSDDPQWHAVWQSEDKEQI